MWLSLISFAAAQQLQIVGFTPDGRLATVVISDGVAPAVHVQLQTLDVGRGTWNHYAADGKGPDVASATAAAAALVPAGYLVPAAQAVAGKVLPIWAEGSRSHDHAVTHVVTWRVSSARGVGEAVLREQAAGCGVEPWLSWRGPGATAPVELLIDRVPRRWPACPVAFDLVEVEEGPRGVLLFVLRVLSVEGQEVATRWVLASWRPPA